MYPHDCDGAKICEHESASQLGENHRRQRLGARRHLVEGLRSLRE